MGAPSRTQQSIAVATLKFDDPLLMIIGRDFAANKEAIVFCHPASVNLATEIFDKEALDAKPDEHKVVGFTLPK